MEKVVQLTEDNHSLLNGALNQHNLCKFLESYENVAILTQFKIKMTSPDEPPEQTASHVL